jgi:hypothetical protein|tara:strand:+ start:176 stop:448 length:273 start_codon:yes stop_codon:yes gene_type:complete
MKNLINEFTFKRQSNGLFSVSIHKNLRPKWKYKNLTKKQVFVAEQVYNNSIDQLFEGEYLECLGYPKDYDEHDFNYWIKQYIKNQNSKVF